MVIGNVRYRNEGAAELHDVLRVTFWKKIHCTWVGKTDLFPGSAIYLKVEIGQTLK